MRTEPVIEEMLESACPSIKYRILLEILGQSTASKEMLALQDEILRDPNVQEVLSWQQPDGWLAWDFHGSRSSETGIRILCEKGLSRQHPALVRTLQALEDHPERLDRGIGKAGRILDELGFGGSQMIRATICAYAGLEDSLFVKEQVNEALRGFRAVLELDSLRKFTEEYKGRLVFKPGVRWPSIYHLRLLAFTWKWRTEENQVLLAAAVKRLVELSPIPDICVRNKSRRIAPASFCMHNFNPDTRLIDDVGWMMWFHRMECLARLGVIESIPELKRQVNSLEGLLEAGKGWFTRRLSHPYFAKWGAYTGLQLEPDWRHPIRREYDLTFRSMLISKGHFFRAGDSLHEYLPPL